jgi:hypothetical protein
MTNFPATSDNGESLNFFIRLTGALPYQKDRRRCQIRAKTFLPSGLTLDHPRDYGDYLR